MQLHAHTDWHAFYIILLNSVLLSFYVTHTYIHNIYIYIHCKYMCTHNLCISHAPLNNASHKANCHSLPKISKSRINLGNKSLSEIWSASRCGPERSAAWESWQPGCAKKGIRLLVSFFFFHFFHEGVLQRLRPWIPWREIRKRFETEVVWRQWLLEAPTLSYIFLHLDGKKP